MSIAIDQKNEVVLPLVVKYRGDSIAIYTEDGKLLANQTTEGHIFYVNKVDKRYMTLRTAFLIDGSNVKIELKK